MSELYLGQDGHFYKIKRFTNNSIFFRYEVLSEEEIKKLEILLHGIKSQANPEVTEPATNDGGNSDSDHGWQPREVILTIASSTYEAYKNTLKNRDKDLKDICEINNACRGLSLSIS